MRYGFTWLMCRVVGCSSLFARWFEWPVTVCHKLTDWLYPELSPDPSELVRGVQDWRQGRTRRWTRRPDGSWGPDDPV